jgi:hypothetical protein
MRMHLRPASSTTFLVSCSGARRNEVSVQAEMRLPILAVQQVLQLLGRGLAVKIW